VWVVCASRVSRSGVCLEKSADVRVDNILITDDGYENLTPTPKEIGEIVKIIKG
jgi:hypothetical protein